MSLFFSTATLLAQPVAANDDAYATSIAALGALLAHWRLGDTSTASLGDASGNGHAGAYAGAPSLQAVDLTQAWQASDGRSVDFGASGSASVAHAAAFALAQGSLSFWFEANALNAELISKGDFALTITSSGAIQVQFTSGGGVVLETIAGIVATGEPHHLMVSWSGKAAWLWFDGRYAGKTYAHTTGLTGNGSAWTLGAGNVQLDEIALYGAARTFSELATLSQFIGGLGYRSADALATIDVSNASELNAALSSAEPGDHIVLADGIYDGNFDADTDGTRANPIVIRSANGVDNVTITGSGLDLYGDWTILDGVTIGSDSRLRVDGAHCRVTRVKHPARTEMGVEVRSGANFARVDHCFMDVLPEGSGSRHGVRLRPDDDGSLANSSTWYALVDHCHCQGVEEGVDDSGTSGFVVNGSGRNASAPVHFYKCLADEANDSPTLELKSSWTLVEACTFLGPVYSADRHGRENEWRSCYMKEDHNGFGRGHMYIGCTFDGSGHNLRLPPGDATEQDYLDPPEGSSSGNYPASENSEIIGCTFLNGAKVEAGEPSYATDVAASGAGAEGCTNWSVTYNETDYAGSITHAASTDEPYERAVELSTSEVGVLASDPLVPPGWK